MEEYEEKKQGGMNIMDELATASKDPEDPEIGLMKLEHKIKKQKALNFYHTGKYPEAYELFLRLHQIEKVVHGELSEEALETLNNIGVILQLLQRPIESQKIMVQVVDKLTKARGANDKRTRFSKVLQANMLREEKQLKQSIEILTEVYNFEKALPSNDRTFTIRSLSAAHEDARNFYQAYELAEELYKIYRRLHGKNDQKALDIRYLMACLQFEQDKTNDCLKLFPKVLKNQEKYLGHDHVDTHRTKLKFMKVLAEIGRLEEHLDMIKEITGDDNKKSLKTNLLGTAKEVLDAAADTLLIGNYDKTEELYRQALKIQKEVKKESSTECYQTKHKLAQVLEKLGKFTEAVEILEKLIEERKPKVKPECLELLEYNSDLAVVLNSQGKYEQALELNKELMRIADKFHKPLDPITLTVQHTMTLIWISLGKIYQAFNLSLDIAHSRGRILGKDHQDTLETQVVIGLTLRMRKKYQEALGYLQDVYEKRKIALGAEHPLTLNSEREIGDTLSLLKQAEKGLPILQKVYEKQKTLLGSENPDTVKTQLVLVDALTKNGKYTDAEKLFDDGLLSKMKKLFGNGHPNILATQFSWAVLKEKLGKRVEAFKLHRMVYYERKYIFGDEHPITLQSQHEVTMVACRALREEKVLIY